MQYNTYAASALTASASDRNQASNDSYTATVLHLQLFIREQFQDGSDNISVCI